MYCYIFMICFLSLLKFYVVLIKNDYLLISIIWVGKNKKELILKIFGKNVLLFYVFSVYLW